MSAIEEPPPTAQGPRFPRVVVKDPLGVPLKTDTVFQRRIYEAKQRQKAHDGQSMADGDWRLPNVPLPARPDFSRTQPPIVGSVRPPKKRKMKSQDSFTLMGALEEDYSREYQQLRWSMQQAETLPALTGSALIHEQGKRASGTKYYLPFVGAPPTVQRNVSVTDVRHADSNPPAPCTGCSRIPAVLCYGCERDSGPHFHFNKPVRTGGGYTYMQRDLPLNASQDKNPLNWKVSLGEPFSYVFFDGLTYPDLDKYRLTMRITKYPEGQTAFVADQFERDQNELVQVDEEERRRRLKEVLDIMDGKHLTMVLAKIGGKSTIMRSRGSVQSQSRIRKVGRNEGRIRPDHLWSSSEAFTSPTEIPHTESWHSIPTAQGRASVDSLVNENRILGHKTERRKSLYKAPKAFQIKRREHKSTEANSPFSTNRTYDYNLGDGLTVIKSDRRPTEFEEFKRSDREWKEPTAFKLKSREEVEIQRRGIDDKEQSEPVARRVSIPVEPILIDDEDADDELGEEEEVEEVVIEDIIRIPVEADEENREESGDESSQHSEPLEPRSPTPDSGVGSVRIQGTSILPKPLPIPVLSPIQTEKDNTIPSEVPNPTFSPRYTSTPIHTIRVILHPRRPDVWDVMQSDWIYFNEYLAPDTPELATFVSSPEMSSDTSTETDSSVYCASPEVEQPRTPSLADLSSVSDSDSGMPLMIEDVEQEPEPVPVDDQLPDDVPPVDDSVSTLPLEYKLEDYLTREPTPEPPLPPEKEEEMKAEEFQDPEPDLELVKEEVETMEESSKTEKEVTIVEEPPKQAKKASKKAMKAASKREKPKKREVTPEPVLTTDRDSLLGTDDDGEPEETVDMSFIRQHTLPSPAPTRPIDPPPLPRAEPPCPPKVPLYNDPERPKREVSQTQFEAPPPMTEPPKQRRPPPAFKPRRKQRERRIPPITRTRNQSLPKKEIREFADPLDYLAKYCIIHSDRLPFYERVFHKVVSEQVYKYIDIPDENGKYATLPGVTQEDQIVLPSDDSDRNNEPKKGKVAFKDKDQMKTRLTQKEREAIDGYTMVNHHMSSKFGTVGMTEGDQAVKKINFTLDSLIDKYENLHERLDQLLIDRVQHVADVARKVYPEISRPDWSPSRVKKRKKSPKRKKATKKESIVTCIGSINDVKGVDTSRSSYGISDVDVVKRMDTKMLERVDGNRGVALLNLEIQRIQEKLRDVDDRIEDLEDEKKLLQLYCRDKHKENQTSDAKSAVFLRRQSTLFQKMNPGVDTEMNLQEVEEALQQINGYLISEKEMQFIFHVLDLPGRRRVNMKLFSAVAALSEKVVQVDPFIRKLLNKLDFEALTVKMDRVKELFYLLEGQDVNVPNGKISAHTLGVELAAGGISQEHANYVVDKFNREKKGIVDFLDFLIYVPLFIEIHSRIIDNPLESDRSM